MTTSNCTWCKIHANCLLRPVYHMASIEPEGRNSAKLLKDDSGNSLLDFNVFYSDYWRPAN